MAVRLVEQFGSENGKLKMRYQRRNHRPDANQASIIAGLRKAGAVVFPIGRPVDLLVGFRRMTVLLELKDGEKAISARKLGDIQAEFFATWSGGPAYTVESLDDALKAIGAI